MCGVVGIVALGNLNKPMEAIRQEAMIYMATELLRLTEPRGDEATGLAVSFEDGQFIGLKMGIGAGDFVARFGDDETYYNQFIEHWRARKAKLVIGHCRKPSASGNASPDDNKNNHPIKIGETIGVHNGTLTNHEEIFKSLNCGRDGKVDSEAIFRLVNHYTKNGEEPFTGPIVQEVCKRLSGSFACLTFNGNNPFQLATFCDDRPLEAMFIRPLKMVVIGSEEKFLKQVVFEFNLRNGLYTPGKNRMERLRKGDVEFKKLPDKSLFIFNTTTEVAANTELKDLYETGSVPRADKIWTKAVVTTTGTTSVVNKPEQTTTGNVSEKKSGADAASADNSASALPGDSSNKIIGLVLDAKLRKYIAVDGVDRRADEDEETKKHANVIVSVDDLEVVSVVTGDVIFPAKKNMGQQQSDLNQAQQEEVSCLTRFDIKEFPGDLEDIIDDPYQIKETSIPGHAATDVVKPAKINKAAQNLEKVDMSVDTKALEKSMEAAKNLMSFSNDAEVADALEICDTTTLACMPAYTLANKLRKWAFQSGWYAGFTAASKLSAITDPPAAKDLLSKYRDKTKRSEATMKSLKGLISILGKLAKDSSPSIIGQVVSDVMTDRTNINFKALPQIIKVTDIKQAPVLEKVIEAVKTRGEING